MQRTTWRFLSGKSIIRKLWLLVESFGFLRIAQLQIHTQQGKKARSARFPQIQQSPDLFAGIEKRALRLGDYSIAGMEELCVVERKDLSDLVHSCTTDRTMFISRMRRMASYPHRLLVISSPLSQIKSPYPYADVNPNRITQSLVAILAGLHVPFLYTETHELGEELVASFLYQMHLYHWLETNGYGRFLVDGDL